MKKKKSDARSIGGGGWGEFDQDRLEKQRRLNIDSSPIPKPSDLTDAKRAFEQAARRVIENAEVRPDWISEENWNAMLSGDIAAPWPFLSKMYSEGGERAYGGADEDGFVGDDKPHNNMQPYLALNYIIKIDSTARAAYVDGLDLSLGMKDLTDTEDDVTYDDGDMLIYHGGQSPGLKNKWKSFKLFDGWTADITVPNQGFKFWMPGASGSEVGQRGAVTFGGILPPQKNSSVVCSYGDIELGSYAATSARIIEGRNFTATTPPSYLSINADTQVVLDSRTGIKQIIDSYTAKAPGVFGQDNIGQIWSVGRGGQGGGYSGASADGFGAAGERKYEEVFRVTDTGRVGILCDTSGLNSNATGVVYGEGYTDNGKPHSGLHIEGGLRLRRGAVVVDGITADMSETHGLEDNELPTVGAVRSYVDGKLGEDGLANTIQAQASGIFRLKDIIIPGGTAESPDAGQSGWQWTIDLNNLTPANEYHTGSCQKIGTFDREGATAGIIIQPNNLNQDWPNNKPDISQLYYHHHGAGNHELVTIYAQGWSSADNDFTDPGVDCLLQIFATQVNT